jgi:hypothetical protein
MPNKLERADMQAAMLLTVRAFPEIAVKVYRAKFVRVGLGQSTPVLDATTLAYSGEAIFFAVGDAVARLALGTIILSTPLLVIPTSRDIRVRDLAVIKGLMYEVTDTTDFALAGIVLNLKLYQSGAA